MDSLSIILSSSPPIRIQNCFKTLKFSTSKPCSSSSLPIQNHLPNIRPSLSAKNSFLSLTTLHLLTSLPSLASESLATPTTDKINLESILVSIDDFFNRYPFFVAGCTFIWLVVIPVTKQLLRKYNFISAIDAFRKLKDDKNAQLLDIREKKSMVALESPNLKILDKTACQVEFSEEDEDGFVKNVLEKFPDPANTILCILDNFDGNSMRAAELLFKNGFKEAYAIRGGVRGKKGWLAIQETLLPPSVNMYPKKKKKKDKISQLGTNGGVGMQSEEKNNSVSSAAPSIEENQRADNRHITKFIKSTSHMKIDSRSPYPRYPDLKPPSSPTPSKP
ncbi:hypothetical protein JCGZ_15072 [Jatropha curcas]|uniref:Rhodanese domain-containing protein n=2 Tax=Jatropha curcas TaxID=180498 RepID=A0A067LA11_JATCU|nr:hypothetical protein JCGZ_15072 [Jatropha curcas]